jgi:branched-chain amino acid transport system ATP-binding protein
MTSVASAASVASGTALEIRDVEKRFGGLKVLDGVSFEVAAGSITSLIGPNGSGKSTLLNIVSGVLSPDSGEVVFEGASLRRVPSHVRAARGMARTFQTVRLFQDITAAQNVMVGRHSHLNARLPHAVFRPRAVARENRELVDQAEAALRLAGLAPHKHHVLLSRLSITDQRAVELARALVGEPTMLVLDEPSGGLDPDRLDEWIGVLMGVRAERGVSILLVEHRMRMVMEISDHVVALHAGGVLARGSSIDVINDPDVRRLYLGSADAVG